MRALVRLAAIASLSAALGCGKASSSGATVSEGRPDASEAEGGDASQDEASASDAASVDATVVASGDAEEPGEASPSSPPGVLWIGRADTAPAAPGALGRFAWSGSGFSANVSGSQISVELQTEGATSSAFFTPVVDGVAGARFQVMTGSPQTVVLATGLSGGGHTVEVFRESEGAYGDDVLFGFPDGTLGPPPDQGSRLVEVIGDSISAGYGNLGAETHTSSTSTSCSFTLDTESAYASYASVLGRTLGAEVSIIARSGWGMYRDYTGDTANVVPSIYDDTLGAEAAPAWSFDRQADAVLIDLGTNDSATGDPGQPYEDAYVAFLHTVRGHYPSAWIFLTIGPMTSDPLLGAMRTHLANVVQTLGDAKVTTIDVSPEDTSSTGCNYHPDVAEDMTMAAALAPTMKQKLGW